ncbi:ribosomal protein L7/L12 [Gemmata sp. JC673]|uniref:Ribosomal protein L7/L12 n=1 Tax=Gemmata algarum TaxID=2975278 RepID=A0ABU5F241_9BACT|nr:ribosomal protein L7/L12 [Gemmata algarum]MDY3561203.1 ribosomal protein L7/L12 [Gemmata algarum]
MSDEAAFLEALKTNPADDTVRLVYADWLDERDQPDKAQYLRAVTDLARLPGGTPAFTDAATQLYTASVRTDESWRRAAGARFDVRLDRYSPSHKIQAIKIIRERTGLSLSEAKALAESVPTPLFSWLPFETALPHVLAFDMGRYKRGLPIAVSVRPTAWPEGAPGAVFDVLICALCPEADGENHHVVQFTARALNLGYDEAAARLRTLPLVVGCGIHPAAVADFVRRMRAACNFRRALPTDAIRVVPRVPAPEACS